MVVATFILFYFISGVRMSAHLILNIINTTRNIYFTFILSDVRRREGRRTR